MPMPDRPPLSPRDVWGAQMEPVYEWVEDAVSDSSIASFVEDPASQTRAAVEAIAGAALTPDPDNPGFYIITSGSSVTPDPDNPGFYKIGA